MNNQPYVRIVSPTKDQVFDTSGYIVLTATSTDPEDKVLYGSALTWSSDLDGYLGQGQRVEYDAGSLARGRHLITVTARDSGNLIARHSVPIQVTEGPIIKITSPQSGAAFRDEIIALRSTVETWIGGAVLDEDVTWYALHENTTPWITLGIGRNINVSTLNLAAGLYEITAVAETVSGLTGADSIFVSLNDPNDNPGPLSGRFPGQVYVRHNAGAADGI